MGIKREQTLAEKADEIDKWLRNNKIERAAKNDIRTKFNLTHNEAPPIYSGLKSLGWIITWTDVRLPRDI